jgi:glyoxylase-like metal-dependent hydrolase (beta-lactamase superfamily II)
MEQQLIRIAENIFLWPHDPDPVRVQPSIGVIAAEHESILVDAGNSPSIVKRLKAAMEEMGLPGISCIIYTHHHWDHISGARELDVPVVAHSLCRDILLEEAKKPWSSQFLQEEILKTPRNNLSYTAFEQAIGDWKKFRIIVPEVVFDVSMTIPMDRLTIELEHVGGEHARDSIVVKIPEVGVMFLGDCYFPPPLHLRGPHSSYAVSMLEMLAKEGYQLYIDSHNDPFTQEELGEFLKEI